MPELPEVETICRGIRPHIAGRKIENIRHSGKKLRTPVPLNEMLRILINKSIIDVRRRAKYILVEMEDSSLLIIHLGMTGNLGILTTAREIAKHCHLRFHLDNGMELRYTDPRRFGSVHVLSHNEAKDIETTFFGTTGPEPFSNDFKPEYLLQKAYNRSIPVKTFIMTNQIVAGIGNIYANESLFIAGIHPQTNASTIKHKSWETLIKCARGVLAHAIDCGGSTISDYVNALQEKGYFQINFQVYGREGKSCNRCGSNIIKQNIGGRASYICPICQRLLCIATLRTLLTQKKPLLSAAAFFHHTLRISIYFFFLRVPARAAKPAPKSNIVAGSGTGVWTVPK